MKLLVMGGTGFVGRAFVEEAAARGHEVTLFNRGQKNPELFAHLEQIHGDRGVDVSGLDGREWDAVFDSSGYVPRVVDMSAQRLKNSVQSYLFISTISVYRHSLIPNQDESGELAATEGLTTQDVTGESYGSLKVLCEERVRHAFGNRALIVRPGWVVGPHDTTDRFTHWPLRMARGGDVLVPDVKDQPLQFIDARDLGEWCLGLLERRVTGTFNATGPETPYSLEQVLTACAVGTDAKLIWADPDFLVKNDVQPSRDFPFVLGYDGASYGMTQIDNSKAKKAGLKFRPLAESIKDTLAWAQTLPADHKWPVGLPADREAELLKAWYASQP